MRSGRHPPGLSAPAPPAPSALRVISAGPGSGAGGGGWGRERGFGAGFGGELTSKRAAAEGKPGRASLAGSYLRAGQGWGRARRPRGCRLHTDCVGEWEHCPNPSPRKCARGPPRPDPAPWPPLAAGWGPRPGPASQKLGARPRPHLLFALEPAPGPLGWPSLTWLSQPSRVARTPPPSSLRFRLTLPLPSPLLPAASGRLLYSISRKGYSTQQTKPRSIRGPRVPASS